MKETGNIYAMKVMSKSQILEYGFDEEIDL